METVLVVDDADAVRRMLSAVLQAHGYAVATASSGEEAMAYLAAHDLPYAIVLDLEMPVMDGWAFRHWQQHHPRFAHIPVIIVSGTGERQQACEVLEPAAYLDKPFDLALLLAALRSQPLG